MSDLFVDGPALAGLRRELDGAARELDLLSHRLARASAHDLGSARLDAAAYGFFDSWRHGTKRLGEAADVVARQVDEALRVYREADLELTERLRSMPCPSR